jgi:hypothetical protein
LKKLEGRGRVLGVHADPGPCLLGIPSRRFFQVTFIVLVTIRNAGGILAVERLVSRAHRLTIVAMAILCLIPTRVEAFLTWEGVCEEMSSYVFDDRSSFVAAPTCVGATTLGSLTFVSMQPIAIVAAGLAYPWGEPNDAWLAVSRVSIAGGAIVGSAVIGAPFYVVKKVAWDGPQALMYPPPRADEWRRRPS